MKRNKVFLILPAIFVGIAILFLTFVLLKEIKPRRIDSFGMQSATDAINQNNDTVSLIGAVWTSGLLDEEKEMLGIDPGYQIVKPLKPTPKGNQSEKISSAYLLSNSVELFNYLGRCVSITGKIVNGWENLEENNYIINGKWTYGRSALVVNDVSIIDVNNCVYDFDWINGRVDGQEYEKFVGQIGFAERPAPDISYDFEIILPKPYEDDRNATGRAIWRDALDISPGTDEILVQLLENIGKDVEIYGYWEWGYAESRFFMVTAIYASI